MINSAYFLEIPLDILDSAIYECLPGYAPGWASFVREELSTGSVIYKVSQDQLGEVGSIIIRKSTVDKTVLQVESASWPVEVSPTATEWKKQKFSKIESRTERLNKQLEFLKKFRDESHALHRRRKDHLTQVVDVLFNRMANDLAVRTYFRRPTRGLATEPIDFIDDFRNKMTMFKTFIERQAYRDIIQNGNPQESVARGLLQAFLTERSYREVPVRGGQTDLLIPLDKGRILFETKIWRGLEYFEQGLREISEYVKGENEDNRLLCVFYVVFDPSVSRIANGSLSEKDLPKEILGVPLEIIVIDLRPSTPSKRL